MQPGVPEEALEERAQDGLRRARILGLGLIFGPFSSAVHVRCDAHVPPRCALFSAIVVGMLIDNHCDVMAEFPPQQALKAAPVVPSQRKGKKKR